MSLRQRGANVLLKNGVSLKQLPVGTDFEVEPNDVQDSSDSEDELDDKSFDSFKEEFEQIALGEDCDDDNLSSGEVRGEMLPLTEDKLVLKLEVKPGAGQVIPDKAAVIMHYNAFVENEKLPFDSTYLRKKPFRFVLGTGKLVIGLEIGVGTMKKGEVSKFRVHSEYAYGPMGIPPRIPPGVTIVYQVEILSFYHSAEAIEFEEMTAEEQRNAPFLKVLAVCKLEHQVGNEMFSKKNYQPAVGRYQKAVRLLEDISVSDEEEDKKRMSYLLKLYLNLAIANLRLSKFKKTILFANKALRIDSQNSKALYRLGYAYMQIGEFEDAKHFLLQAKRIEPYSEEINAALMKLNRKYEVYAAWDKSFCKKIFQCGKTENSEKKKNEENIKIDESVKIDKDIRLLEPDGDFVQVLRDKIEQFKNSSETSYTFSSGFTPSQIVVIQAIAESNGLQFIEKIFQKERVIKIMK